MGVRFDRDDHVEVAEYFLGQLAVRRKPRGVVHVGAHRGEEVDSYLRFGCEHVLLVEANPDHARELVRAFSDRPEVMVLNYAAADRDGDIALQLHTSRSGNTEAASILPLKRFSEIVPTMRTAGTVNVPATRLDAMFERHGLDVGRYDLLVIDVQGAELMVLQGAEGILPAFDAALVELALVELYEHGSDPRSVRQLLVSAGFEEVATGFHELYDATTRFPGWAEALFVRPGVDGSMHS